MKRDRRPRVLHKGKLLDFSILPADLTITIVVIRICYLDTVFKVGKIRTSALMVMAPEIGSEASFVILAHCPSSGQV